MKVAVLILYIIVGIQTLIALTLFAARNEIAEGFGKGMMPPLVEFLDKRYVLK